MSQLILLVDYCVPFHTVLVSAIRSELISGPRISRFRDLREQEQCVMQSLLTAAVGGEYVVTVEKYIVAMPLTCENTFYSPIFLLTHKVN